MKTVALRISIIFLTLFFINSFGQNYANKYCYNSTDNDGIKTELNIEIFKDKTYKLTSQILSSSKYGEIKKIKDENSGIIIQKNGKSYFKPDNDENPNSILEFKLRKNKLIIIGQKKTRKLFSSKYDYVQTKGIIFSKNNCEKNE